MNTSRTRQIESELEMRFDGVRRYLQGSEASCCPTNANATVPPSRQAPLVIHEMVEALRSTLHARLAEEAARGFKGSGRRNLSWIYLLYFDESLAAKLDSPEIEPSSQSLQWAAYVCVRHAIEVMNSCPIRQGDSELYTKAAPAVSRLVQVLALGLRLHASQVYDDLRPAVHRSRVRRIENWVKAHVFTPKDREARVPRILRPYILELRKRKLRSSAHARLAAWLIESLLKANIGFSLQAVDRDRDEADCGPSYKGTDSKGLCLNMSRDVLLQLEGASARELYIHPYLRPMTHPPLDWEADSDKGVYDGGYLTLPLPLIRRRPGQRTVVKDGEDLSNVLTAINYVQGTAWQVNRKVLPVMLHFWEQGSDPKLLPGKTLEPLLVGDSQGNPTTANRSEAAAERRAIVARNDRRKQLGRMLHIAQNLQDEPRFFFPHFMDRRGRMYPYPQDLSPQGGDVARSLLLFAEARPLGPSGCRFLAHALAHFYGKGPVGTEGATGLTLEEEVAWCREAEVGILASAHDPLHEQFWRGADDPWCFLAACLEWAAYRSHIAGGRPPGAFMSTLPVPFDGTCNGLQHLAALSRDRQLAADVNVVATFAEGRPERRDIYELVGDDLLNRLECDASFPRESLGVVRRHLRALAKTVVMTIPYGSTTQGRRNAIWRYLEEHAPQALECSPAIERHLSRAAFARFGIVRKYMDWMRGLLANAARKHSRDEFRWVAPSGFRVCLAKKRRKQVRISLDTGSRKLHVAVADHSAAKLCPNKQRNAVVADLVHSMDAAHLVKVVNSCATEGVRSFMVVHDCYATHAADAEILLGTLRREFAAIYSSARPDPLFFFIEDNMFLDQSIYSDYVNDLHSIRGKSWKDSTWDADLAKPSEFFFH